MNLRRLEFVEEEKMRKRDLWPAEFALLSHKSCCIDGRQMEGAPVSFNNQSGGS